MTNAELLQKVAKEVGLSPWEMRRVLASAPFRYRKYFIDKRNGGKREINHPTPELKAIQRWIVEHVITAFPVHDCVYSYRRGRGIRDNANAHLYGRYFLKLDFEDFFPSVNYSDVRQFLLDGVESGLIELDDESIGSICRFVCLAPRGRRSDSRTMSLSIGAPSSPAITNAILYPFDCVIFDLCEQLEVQYTRYADDLFFSTRHPHVISGLRDRVSEIVGQWESPNIVLNRAKVSTTSRKFRVTVTGLNITPEGRISVGRSAKREVKALVYRHILGELTREQTESLKGTLAFFKGVEPAFIDALVRKYGRASMSELVQLAGR